MIPEDKLAEYDNLLEPIHSIENCFCDEYCYCHIAPPCGHCVKCIDKDEHHDSVLEALQNTLNEIDRLKNIANGFKSWGTDDCKSCDDGRITLYVWNKECISCNPKSYDQVETQIDRLTKQNQIMREALNKIATHDTLEGAKYNSYSTAYTGLVDFAAKALKEAGEVK